MQLGSDDTFEMCMREKFCLTAKKYHSFFEVIVRIAPTSCDSGYQEGDSTMVVVKHLSYIVLHRSEFLALTIGKSMTVVAITVDWPAYGA